MRTVPRYLLLMSTLALAGCQSKASKAKHLQDQYNANHPPYTKESLDPETTGAARILTGENLTAEQMATLETKKKERDARSKPEADRLAQIQKEILAAQQ
jgi:type IV pilus biogenesis protein CpaD/CtpE